MALTETLHPGAFIVSESDQGFYSRDAVLIALSQTIRPGMVLGKRAIVAGVTSSAAAAASNTGGSGAMTLDVTAPVGAGVQDGVYQAICIEPASNGGTFEVFDPQGVSLGVVAVGGTFNNQIKFVIADATDFVAGDRFLITVGVEYDGDMEYLAHDPAATDGSQVACAIAIYGVTTDGSTKQKIAALTRRAEVRLSDLEFKSGISAANKAETIDQLRAVGIVCR
jgi:hypothetical protein